MTRLAFTQDHEYVRAEADGATVGISSYAQEQLGDIVFVELPAIGASFKKGEEMAVVESVKAASEIYAPVDCTITAVNEALNDDPAKVNADPLGEGWLVKVTVSQPAQLDELMDETAYATRIA